LLGEASTRRCWTSCHPEADPCGERGEFHTFVWAGPMFESPLAIRLGEIVERDGFVFADLVPERRAG
jgi:diphthamide synthase (EF-2-diphthine--ammonia ligase)